MESEADLDHSLPDLSLCDVEPIHLAGAIQPYGALLALQGPRLKIAQATPTCQALLGRELSELLDHELEDVLDPQLAQGVRQAMGPHLDETGQAVAFTWRPPSGTAVFECHVHRSEGLILLELEPLPESRQTFLPEDRTCTLADLNAVRAQSDLRLKARAAAVLVRRISGFDRVMIYRFDPDWHGEVIGEDRRSDLESYLGLHYPATDIPAQARRLFLLNPTRVISDIGVSAAPLVPPLNPLTGQPLDLSLSLLRSVSPVHLEYLGNMGVAATLTISLTRDDRLWGLIACHHQTPYRVSRQVRETLVWLGQDLATQLALAEELSSRRYEASLKVCRERVINAMRRGVRLAALVTGPELADVMGAMGAEGVALIRDSEVVTGGITPEPARIRNIADRLSALHPEGPSALFLTDCLSEHLPETADLAATASGVAVFPLEARPSLKLVWFRGERLRHVTWGGNPEKVARLNSTGRLSPRQSFAAWTEIVSQHSLPWTDEEVESAKALTTLVDIELRKNAEEALREANRHKDEFLAMLGHELRNPLAPIRHAVEVLRLSPSQDQIDWAVRILTRQVDHVTRLVDDLLDVARISRGKLRLRRRAFDLRQAVEKAVEQVRPLLDARSQRLESRLPPLPVVVDGDTERLTQVIVNLLGNATKFSAPNRPIALTLSSEQGEAVLRIQDQGIGMAAPLLPRIFAPFAQGAQTAERAAGGLGLGLALVQGLVELHSGRVQALSPGEGRGSTFIVRLPLRKTSLEPSAAVSEPRCERGRVVLIVDDNLDVAESCAMLLSCLNQEVHTAHDGPAALESAARLRPNLILLDIGLPGMDGYEVACRLRATRAGREARLVALTGYSPEDAAQRAQTAGFDEYLLKPVDSKALIQVLERCP